MPNGLRMPQTAASHHPPANRSRASTRAATHARRRVPEDCPYPVHATCASPLSNNPGHEQAPANPSQCPAAFVVRCDQGRVARVDDALPVRVRLLAVIGRRHPRQGREHSTLAHALPSVRQALLTHDLSRGLKRWAAARCVRGSGHAGVGGVWGCWGAATPDMCKRRNAPVIPRAFQANRNVPRVYAAMVACSLHGPRSSVGETQRIHT